MASFVIHAEVGANSPATTEGDRSARQQPMAKVSHRPNARCAPAMLMARSSLIFERPDHLLELELFQRKIGDELA